ncbi:MAG: TolC family protein, partial [Myxococcales bacterium]|nr:TolC family protein [Myxococcales bacterium]
AAFFEVRALEDELLPDAEKALEQAQRAYARREVALRDVLNARSVFYRARAERVKTLEAYHHALADLEELVDTGTGSQL